MINKETRKIQIVKSAVRTMVRLKGMGKGFLSAGGQSRTASQPSGLIHKYQHSGICDHSDRVTGRGEGSSGQREQQVQGPEV